MCVAVLNYESVVETGSDTDGDERPLVSQDNGPANGEEGSPAGLPLMEASPRVGHALLSCRGEEGSEVMDGRQGHLAWRLGDDLHGHLNGNGEWSSQCAFVMSISHTTLDWRLSRSVFKCSLLKLLLFCRGWKHELSSVGGLCNRAPASSLASPALHAETSSLLSRPLMTRQPRTLPHLSPLSALPPSLPFSLLLSSHSTPSKRARSLLVVSSWRFQCRDEVKIGRASCRERV